MAAEALSHRGEDTVAPVGLAARREAIEERRDEHRCGHALLDRRQHRPPALAGVAHAPRVLVEVGRRVQRLRREIEQPRGDDGAAAPDLCDRGDVELVLVVVGLSQGRRLGVRFLRVEADVRMLEDVQPLGICLHEAVLDPVVDHLHEVPCTRRAAVQPALLLGCRIPRAPRGADSGVDTGREGVEYGHEPTHGLVVAADHHAVAALAAPDAPAGAHVDVVDLPATQLARAAEVVDVV